MKIMVAESSNKLYQTGGFSDGIIDKGLVSIMQPYSFSKDEVVKLQNQQREYSFNEKQKL